MSFTESIKMALKSLMGNKVRSILTMLGIIIGVGAVIALISLVEGATAQITDRIAGMGANLITVNIPGRGSNRRVSADDMLTWAEENKTLVEAIAPVVSGSVTAKVGNQNISTSLEGTNSYCESVRNLDITNGRFISEIDVERRTQNCVIGTYVVSELFSDVADPVGQSIKINGEPYTVVGVLKETASSAQRSADDKIIIAYTTASRLVGNSNIGTFYVQAKTKEVIEQAKAYLEAYLYSIFQNDTSYMISSLEEVMEAVNEATATLSLMLGGIAGISLLVGGIGIMNIMLVSVTERTREIGIRKAIGAKRRTILLQFLIESIVISGLGGVLGIVAGYSIGIALGNAFEIAVSPGIGTIILAVGFSMVMGVFFGIYPAAKASGLSPIEALRFE